ncbi:MAG: 50S ribosomal protein L39e [Candidatus Micrarchaeota archaeon]
MSSNKTRTFKKKLGKAARINRRIPLFVIAKTKRRIRFNRGTRNWLQKKLRIKKDE